MKSKIITKAFAATFLVMSSVPRLGLRVDAADILIDNFNTGVHSLTINAPASPIGTTISTNLTGLSGVLGGSRSVALTLDAGTSGSVSSVGALGGAYATLGEDVGMSGTIVFKYNANGAGLGNIDLTQGGALNKFRLNLLVADNVAQFRIDVIDGLTTASYATNFGTLALNVNLDFPFLAFSNPSALISADEIRLTIIGVPAGDYILNNLAVVPEAGTTTAATVAIVGTGGWWLRRRRIRGQRGHAESEALASVP